MLVPWMLLTPAFVPWWSVSPARPCTQRVPFKTGMRSFSWQGMDWCGGQPGGDRGGALAAQDKWPLCATFGEVKGGKGREEAANKGCLYTPLLHPRHPLSSTTTTPAVTSRCHRQMKGLCVFMAGFVSVREGGK